MIILPEMFTTGFTMNPKNVSKEEGQLGLEWMQQTAAEKNAAIVGSIPFYENAIICSNKNQIISHVI